MTDTTRQPAQLYPLYAVPEVQRASAMPREVVIHDVTLRDGEQTHCGPQKHDLAKTVASEYSRCKRPAPSERVRLLVRSNDAGIARWRADHPCRHHEDGVILSRG